MQLLSSVVLAVVISMASAACPNLCNGNGNCLPGDVCSCYANWQGPDCSERTCPFDFAWVDAPTATGTAHWYAECSNAGVCDRTSGLCNCYTGYEGKGCARSSCPNGCSGHGTCRFIDEITTTNSKFSLTYTGVYSAWDANKIQACVCDANYEGTDCSLRSCPQGNNVLITSATKASVQKVCLFDQITGASPSGEFTLTFTDLYGGVWTTRPITTAGVASDGTWDGVTASAIQFALEGLPNAVLPSVTVTGMSGGGVLGVCYQVTFSDAATTGLQNLLQVNIGGCTRAGCSPHYTGLASHQGTGADGGVQWTVTDISDLTAVTGHSVCSDHGLCDYTSGTCTCFSGFYDLDCNEQTVLV